MEPSTDQQRHPEASMAATGHPTDSPDQRQAERSESEPVTAYRGSGIMWSGIAIVVVMALLVIAAFQNTQNVTFDFLWFEASIPLILILAITFGIAIVAAETIGFVWRHRRRKQRRERDELVRLRRRSGGASS